MKKLHYLSLTILLLLVYSCGNKDLSGVWNATNGCDDYAELTIEKVGEDIYKVTYYNDVKRKNHHPKENYTAKLVENQLVRSNYSQNILYAEDTDRLHFGGCEYVK